MANTNPLSLSKKAALVFAGASLTVVLAISTIATGYGVVGLVSVFQPRLKQSVLPSCSHLGLLVY
jgi:hypothetical protein